MAKEIEYKFLLEQVPKLDNVSLIEHIEQGYLSATDGVSTRVRVISWNTFYDGREIHSATLTIKGPKNGLSCKEFEYDIPVDEARQLMAMCKGTIKKTRYLIPHGDLMIELDVFGEFFEGLVIAEVEVESEDIQVTLPDYFGKVVDVSTDSRYTNASIVKNGIPK